MNSITTSYNYAHSYNNSQILTTVQSTIMEGGWENAHAQIELECRRFSVTLIDATKCKNTKRINSGHVPTFTFKPVPSQMKPRTNSLVFVFL